MRTDELKLYVVYDAEHDQIGVHYGPKFIEFGEGTTHYWPHDIQHWGYSSLMQDEAFRENYIYLGDL